jgi:hypothetical protein
VQRLDDRVIADRYGVPTWRVTRHRRELNIVRQRVSRTRAAAGAASSRPGPEVLHLLFVTQALPIWVIAEQFHTSPWAVRRWLTDAGYRLWPRGDRRQDPPAVLGPVVAALHSDPEVTALLRRHQIHPDSSDGDPAGRLPTVLTRPFLQQAHHQIGLSIDQIALLTGHTPHHLRQALHANGIRATTDPGFSPWATRTVRWRVGG